jgi:hypothetical protein
MQGTKLFKNFKLDASAVGIDLEDDVDGVDVKQVNTVDFVITIQLTNGNLLRIFIEIDGNWHMQMYNSKDAASMLLAHKFSADAGDAGCVFMRIRFASGTSCTEDKSVDTKADKVRHPHRRMLHVHHTWT